MVYTTHLWYMSNLGMVYHCFNHIIWELPWYLKFVMFSVGRPSAAQQLQATSHARPHARSPSVTPKMHKTNQTGDIVSKCWQVMGWWTSGYEVQKKCGKWRGKSICFGHNLGFHVSTFPPFQTEEGNQCPLSPIVSHSMHIHVYKKTVYAYSKIYIHIQRFIYIYILYVYIHVFYVICEYVFTSLVHKSHKFPLLVSLGCRRAALNPPPAYQAQGPGQGGYQAGGAFETANLIEN